jgi:hypothetical protein
MRTSRGLKLASFVVLSPILLIVLSLFSILIVFIFSHLTSWYPIMKIFSPLISLTYATSTTYPLHCTKSARKTSLYTRLRRSPFVWCIILIYAIYVIHKVWAMTDHKSLFFFFFFIYIYTLIMGRGSCGRSIQAAD